MALRRIKINREFLSTPIISIIKENVIISITKFMKLNNLNTYNLNQYIDNSFYAFDSNNSKILGVCLITLNPIEHIINIDQLYVGFDFRSKGIATKLINEVVRLYNTDEEYEKIELSVTKDNTRAISLYKHLGFKEYSSSSNSFDYINMYMNI